VRGADVYAVAASSASKAHVIAFRFSVTSAGWWAITTAENNVLSLDFAKLGLSWSRLVAASDGDVCLLCVDLPWPATLGAVASPYGDVVPLNA